MKPEPLVTVVGGGLAGCEAALQLSGRGIPVRLIECKPLYRAPAHSSDNLAELVCSNSLKSNDPATAGGLIKEELRVLGSRVIAAADRCRVPAGGALAVDREAFSALVTAEVDSDPMITREARLVEDFDEREYTILATGPLTAGELGQKIAKRLGGCLFFYDAAAPIVSGDSVDMSRAFTASRYGKGGDDYVNCPMTEEEYLAFYQALITAERANQKDFDKRDVFEGCMPVEIMAARGPDTLRFGPLKPVGFTDPATGRRPYAVVQLRKENAAGTMYNLVGFQTNLRFGEQKRVFGMIPALKEAEFLRYGVMHRNTYVNAPETLGYGFRALKSPRTYIAGQLSGVEGYVESIMSGLVAALAVASSIGGRDLPRLPPETMTGAICGYLISPNANFQPMNANLGLLPPLSERIRDKRERGGALAARSLAALRAWKTNVLPI